MNKQKIQKLFQKLIQAGGFFSLPPKNHSNFEQLKEPRFPFNCFHLFPNVLAGAEEDISSEESAAIDPERVKAEELAKEARKKAGLPTLDLDALPSSIATKMMTLGSI